MEIFVNRGGEQFGPYPEDSARQYLQDGSLSADDLCWHDGLPDWTTLAKILGIAPAAPEPPAPKAPKASAFIELPKDALPPDTVPKPRDKSPWKPGKQSILAPVVVKESGKGKGHFADYLMNLIIAGLVLGGGYYYFFRGAGQPIAHKWLTKLQAMTNQAAATAPASTPAPIPAQPSVTQAKTSDAPAAAVASEMPAAAPVAASTPAGPQPIDWAAIAASPARWPKTVLLSTAVTFPVMYNGQPAGSIAVPVGTACKLVAMQGDQLTLEYQGNAQQVPRQSTDLEARIRAAGAQ